MAISEQSDAACGPHNQTCIAYHHLERIAAFYMRIKSKTAPPDRNSAPSQTPRPSIPVPPGRFVILFAIAALVQFCLLLTPWVRPAIDGFSWILVHASTSMINFFGGHAVASNMIMRSPANGFAIEMKDGCNGVNVMILLWSAVLAFPVSRSAKLVGLLAGALAIHGLNFFRFVSLFYLGQYNLSWFEFAHLYLWETLIMLDALIVFGVWVRRSSAAPAGSHACG
jgi:exosortase H (IPTLxxWG-CTERM-specific)